MNQIISGTVVRIDPKTRVVIAGVVSAVLALFTVSMTLSLAGFIRNPNPPLAMAGILLVAILLGLAEIVSLYRSRIVLYSDTIEVTRFLSQSRRLAIKDIVGRRFSPAGFRRPPYHVLIIRGGGGVKLPPYLEHNVSFQQWLHTIPLEHP